MRLALIALKNVSDVNNFDEVVTLHLQQGNPGRLYLRLVDQDRPIDCSDESRGYLRHIPNITNTSLQLTFQNIDSNATTVKVATQPFGPNDDRSVFYVDILATDKISFNNINALLTENGVQYNIPILSDIVDDKTGQNRFYC